MNVVSNTGKSVVAALALLSGCATQQAQFADPYADMAAVCPSFSSLICVEKVGQVQNCFCGNKDDLQTIFESNGK
ncbi:MAG: hypothetical protein WBN09_07085 [Woeseiaceae bacterium]